MIINVAIHWRPSFKVTCTSRCTPQMTGHETANCLEISYLWSDFVSFSVLRKDNLWRAFEVSSASISRKYTYFYKQLMSGPILQSCFWIWDFQGSKLLSGCLVVWPNKQTLRIFPWFFRIRHWYIPSVIHKTQRNSQ